MNTNNIEKNLQPEVFRQLREIVDQDKLAERLQQHLGPAFASGEKQIEDCKIEQLHYIPEWEMLLWAYPNDPVDSHTLV